MSYTEILYDVSGRIATITMNRPDRLNAYTGTMGDEMRAAMRAASTPRPCRTSRASSCRTACRPGSTATGCRPPSRRPVRLRRDDVERRVGPVDEGERLDALGGGDDVALHGALPFSSMMVFAMTAS